MPTTINRKTNQNVANTNIFSIDSMDSLKNKMTLMTVKNEDHLYYEGDKVDKLYYIIEGTITLYKSTEDGKVLTLNYYEAEDLFGEYHANEMRGAMENAKARGTTVIGVINKEDIEMLIWQNPQFSLEFTKWISFTQQLTQTKLRDLMFFGKNGALASVIIRMTNTYGIQKGDVWEISKKFTHDEISCLIGTPRETVTRMLNQFKKEGLIDNQKGFITVYDLQGLRQICRCEACPLQVCRL